MNGSASFGDEGRLAVGNIAAQGPLPSRPLRGFRDERNDGISGRGRQHIGDLLLADDADGEHQRAAQQFVERPLQQ